MLVVDNQPDIINTARERSRGMPSHHEDAVFPGCESLTISSSSLVRMSVYALLITRQG
jgi:hypothetical protein